MLSLEIPGSLKLKYERHEATKPHLNLYLKVAERVNRLYDHEVVRNSRYCKWFKLGNANTPQIIDLIEQWFVFSRHFPWIQAKRMSNSDTWEGEEGAREILMNECGVPINMRTGKAEGNPFSHENAHLNWLRVIARDLGLDPSPDKMGRWIDGSPSTIAFLEGLDRTYGSFDGQVGAGASFAIESCWAGYGLGIPELEADNFWNELIAGLDAYNSKYRQGLSPLDTSFFSYHRDLEIEHARNVEDELIETILHTQFNEEKFFDQGALPALDAINMFWVGLYEKAMQLNSN